MNIPFALLSAVILLWATGQTINIMTLGGLALAVGVLVDEATVAIENIHTQMLPGVSRARAVRGGLQPDRHGASAFDVLHSRRVRSFVLHDRRGPAALRAAVAGRGVLDDRVLPAVEQPGPGVLDVADAGSASRRGARRVLRHACARSTRRYLGLVLRFRWPLVLGYLVASIGLLFVLLPRMGTEIFPDANAPLLRHPAAGARRARAIEETERIVLRALDVIRREIGAGQRRDHQRLRRAWCRPATRSI